MQLFGSVFEFFIFCYFANELIKRNYPNVYLELTYKCIYMFSKLQIQLSKWVKNYKTASLSSKEAAVPSAPSAPSNDSTLPKKLDVIKKDEFIVTSFVDNDIKYSFFSSSFDPRPTSLVFVDYKFILVELFIEGESPIMINLKPYMLTGNMLKPPAIKYILSEGYNISSELLSKYTLQIIDQNACSHQLNETNAIEFQQNEFFIHS